VPLGLRRVVLLALVGFGGLVAGIALASCGGEGEATETTETTMTTTTEPEVEKPKVVRIVVVNGAPKGGIVRTSVEKGDRVVIVVASDVADEVHLHGYDVIRNVAAGGMARIAFTAELPGRFEVELEDRGVQIAELTVEP